MMFSLSDRLLRLMITSTTDACTQIVVRTSSVLISSRKERARSQLSKQNALPFVRKPSCAVDWVSCLVRATS